MVAIRSSSFRKPSCRDRAHPTGRQFRLRAIQKVVQP
jgi:hypothetical protein